MRAGTPGTPKSQGERGIPLLPLHHGAADAPAGRQAALLTTLARADELDELVWNEVVRHLDNPELILRSCATPAASTPAADATRQLTDLRSQQARLIDAYQAGVISLRDLEARRRPVTDRITELEQITRQAERHRTSKAELQQRIDAFASQIADGLATMDFNRRQTSSAP